MIIDNLTIAGLISSIAAVIVLLAGIRDGRRINDEDHRALEEQKPCKQA
jgi:hypothetical protein